MSEHDKWNDEKAFIDWLDGQPQQPTLKDKQWQERADVAHSLQHQTQLEHQQSVPNWDRGAAFKSDHQPWWKWEVLPAMSMAFSVLAIALVLFKVELNIKPEGILLSFSGDNKVKNEAIVSALVDLKLREFAAEQQVMLANYATDFTTKQQDSNLQLATYVIGATRQERKEDMNDFIRFINDQRKDENLTQKIKYQQLERKLNRVSYKNSAQPLESEKYKPEKLSYQINPANLNIEE